MPPTGISTFPGLNRKKKKTWNRNRKKPKAPNQNWDNHHRVFLQEEREPTKKGFSFFFLKMGKLKTRLGTAIGEGNARCVFVIQKPLALPGDFYLAVKG